MPANAVMVTAALAAAIILPALVPVDVNGASRRSRSTRWSRSASSA
ncbi:hypothetical protein [Mycolicibacterium austroafricanum]